MRLFSKIFLATLILPLSMLLGAPSYADEIVAIVNKNVILQSELDEAYAKALRSSGDKPPSRRDVLDQIINYMVQLDFAEQFNIYVSDQELAAQAAAILKRQNITRSQQLEILRRQGITYGEWLEDLRDSMRVQKLQFQQLRSYVKISPAEVDGFLVSRLPPQIKEATYDVAHIIVSKDEVSVAELERIRHSMELAESIGEVGDIAAGLEYEDMNFNSFRRRNLSSFPDSFQNQLALMSDGEFKSFALDDYWHLLKLIDVQYPNADIQQEYKLSTISFMTNVVYDEQLVRVRIRDLYSQVQGDADFEELAAIHKEQNSPLFPFSDRWLSLAEMPSAINSQVTQLGTGEFSSPFAYQGGWHLVYLSDKRARDVTLQKWRGEVYQRLASRKFSASLPFFLNDILERSYIEYRI